MAQHAQFRKGINGQQQQGKQDLQQEKPCCEFSTRGTNQRIFKLLLQYIMETSASRADSWSERKSWNKQNMKLQDSLPPNLQLKFFSSQALPFQFVPCQTITEVNNLETSPNISAGSRMNTKPVLQIFYFP